MTFQLHPRLQQDCIEIGALPLCRLLLMNDKQYPWYILVPEITGITEIHQLNDIDRHRLIDESCYLGENLARLYRAEKMNVAALGNLVPQLHLHHVVRYSTDRAWPAPVWGSGDAIPYSQSEILEIIALLRNNLSRCRFL